ncbi:MAG: hypothetical protein J3T61_10085 [Candidatus Brocadiales bacterium]|nr:hypothetical protein [Candidatus Bathyanammoxibius sp.]
MSSRKEREERAFEALIVSQLRKECDLDKVNPEDLPSLTAKEKAALEALNPGLVERLWNEGKKIFPQASAPSRLAPTGELVLNRAEDVNKDTAEELARHRAELLERMKKLNEEKKHG